MARKSRRAKIPEQDTIDLILKRLAGKTLDEIAEEYGVSKQVVQYHEKKELTQELKRVMLTKAAEVAGEALGQRALEMNSLALSSSLDREDEDIDTTDLILGRGRAFVFQCGDYYSTEDSISDRRTKPIVC